MSLQYGELSPLTAEFEYCFFTFKCFSTAFRCQGMQPVKILLWQSEFSLKTFGGHLTTLENYKWLSKRLCLCLCVCA